MNEPEPPAKPRAIAVLARILAFLGLALLFVTLGSIALGWMLPQSAQSFAVDFSSIPGMLVIVAGVLAATWVMVRITPEMSWDALGLGNAAVSAKALSAGAALGALTIGAASASLLLAGQLAVRSAAPGSWMNAALFDVAFFIPAAAIEELLMRGYVFAMVRRRWGWRAALVASSLAFGLLHLFNPGADAESIFSVTVAGFFLGTILLTTGSLYAAIAAHFAWNWTMAAVFHSAVSGEGLASPNYTIVDNGPDWLTGGSWGPEGGAAAAAAMLLLLVHLYRRRIRHLESW